jgi:hypothetical protein
MMLKIPIYNVHVDCLQVSVVADTTKSLLGGFLAQLPDFSSELPENMKTSLVDIIYKKSKFSL